MSTTFQTHGRTWTEHVPKNEIIDWRYASQPVKPDELAALLKALQTIYDLTEGSADGAPDASEHDKLCNRIAGICKEVLP